MRSLKKRGAHVLDDLMTSYFPYNTIELTYTAVHFILFTDMFQLTMFRSSSHKLR